MPQPAPSVQAWYLKSSFGASLGHAGAVASTSVDEPVLLGTVAIEPGRWARGEQRPAPIALSPWLDAAAAAGFDGLEVWERHLTDAGSAEVDAVLSHDLGVAVFNTYTSLDDADTAGRAAVADWAHRSGASGVKFNVGNDPSSEAAYADRIAAWLELLPEETALLCECHHGISIAEVPATAARIFDAVGAADRLGAIVHTHESPDHLRERFDAYGERIRHVHVNFLEFGERVSAPRLSDIVDRLASQVELLRSLGFRGSWTIEFVHGLLTADDHPGATVAQATEDLRVLRSVL